MVEPECKKIAPATDNRCGGLVLFIQNLLRLFCFCLVDYDCIAAFVPCGCPCGAAGFVALHEQSLFSGLA